MFRRLLAVIAILGLTACQGFVPTPTGPATAFGLMGDTPYSSLEAIALDTLIDRLNREELAFIVHVGDITSGRGPCTDEWFRARKAQFDRIRHPFILIPGDNDWTDCHRSGMDPMERLAFFRKLFLQGNESLGQRRIAVERQPAGARHGAYPEHMRWTTDQVMFVTVNVQASNDNVGRTRDMDAEHQVRSGAVRDWLAESAQLVMERGLAALVILMQADPEFEEHNRKPGAPPDVYAGLREQFRQISARLDRPVILVHGDGHVYQQNRPLKNSRGETERNFLRVEVSGSPFVSWLRAKIHPDRKVPVTVEPADQR